MKAMAGETIHPLPHKIIIKKRKNKFIRFQSERFVRIKPSWRKPRGIDSPMRHQYRGQRPMVSIGYGSDKETRFMLPCGFFKHRISNVHELKTLFMNNKTHAAQIAHGVSARSRKQILEEAKKMGVRVLNADAKLRKEEL
ncbi:LSU ribosomal protein L32E [Giardia duodenalis assemblage B]|uniref:LSU ribosomal protein L32E n=1 Tax=Giardia duodenalis assemblage B TaxID=1394984 RepID=A0A132NQB2_GIAIN|nr:LSU ribosomal protein L32E [Giardia intestinalis assemblage B]